jgi:hypothetical protein
MKLSDIVSSLHLTVFAEVPLLMFMGIFLGVCISVFARKQQLEQVAELPLRSERSRRGQP